MDIAKKNGHNDIVLELENHGALQLEEREAVSRGGLRLFGTTYVSLCGQVTA